MGIRSPSNSPIVLRLVRLEARQRGLTIFSSRIPGRSPGTQLSRFALAYQRAVGQGARTRLIGRERGYHGVGFGGLSVGEIVNNRRMFLELPGCAHLRHTHDLVRNSFSKGLPLYCAELADDLERLVPLHGAETIAAVIIEPVTGSAGVLLPPKGYLERLRAICDRHGILLVFDEVITGFGRLEAPFAAIISAFRPISSRQPRVLQMEPFPWERCL